MADGFLIEARNLTVAIEDGRIAVPQGRYDTVLRFPEADVRPGLINAHDHLHRNHYGRLGTPPYADAYAWVDDIRSRHSDAIAAGKAMPRRQALLAGAWKNLFAGVTSVVHHDRWEADFDDEFPLRVVRLGWANSFAVPPGPQTIDPRRQFAIHLAEGCNKVAADEVRRLDALGLLGRNLLAVHGVGMDADAITRFRHSGAALVWCPTSNLFLLGRTVPRELLDGIDVLLGSDSLLTGEGDLLDELRAARALELLDDARLEAAVGATTARRLGLPIPSLEPGSRADLVVLGKPLLEASSADVELVIANGVPRLAHPRLAAELDRDWPAGCPATVRGVTRWTNPGSTDGMNQPGKSGPLYARAS